MQTNETYCQSIAQHGWMLYRCWPRVFKRSQHVRLCCATHIPREPRIDIYPEARATPCEATVTEHSVRKRKPNNIARERNMFSARFINVTRPKEVSTGPRLTGIKLYVTCTNTIQHCPTCCTNDRNMLHPTMLTMLGDVMPTYCVLLHLLVPLTAEKS